MTWTGNLAFAKGKRHTYKLFKNIYIYKFIIYFVSDL